MGKLEPGAHFSDQALNLYLRGFGTQSSCEIGPVSINSDSLKCLRSLTELAEGRLDVKVGRLENVDERRAVDWDRDASDMDGQRRKLLGEGRDVDREGRDANRESRNANWEGAGGRNTRGQRRDCSREGHVLRERRVEGDRGCADGNGEGEESGDLGELHD
jgi:hypothetical protein